MIERMTTKDAIRLGDVISMGPMDRRETDATLIAQGWLIPYDGDETAVEAAEWAAETLYADNGCIRDCFMPQEWLDQKLAAERRMLEGLTKAAQSQLDSIDQMGLPEAIVTKIKSNLNAEIKKLRAQRLAV